MEPTTSTNISKPCKTYTDEFKDGAVRMVTDKRFTITDAAKALGIERSLLSRWISRRAPQWHPSPPPVSDDPSVLTIQLRDAFKEVQQLRAAVSV